VSDPDLLDPASTPARPRGLTVAALLLVVSNLTFFLDVTWMREPGPLVLGLFVMAASFVVIGYFWLGRGWARWMVLAVSVFALMPLATWVSLSDIEKWTTVFNALLGAWLLYWLNTRHVRAYFGRPAGGARRSALALIGIGLFAVALLIAAAVIAALFMSA
jgi:hypothetical protein